ncbi:MAG: AAA family ATPase [Bacteriovoracaceae bacterium]|nr:AAA family ATPase [Bacteriovoracaceae bacterium]
MKNKKGLFLKTLTLQNFATFENQTITFNDHFNAIIGETGSGKSLILDALQLILGQRADKKLIRKHAEFAIIEAIFTTQDKQIKEYFNNIGHPFSDNEVVIKRIIYANSKTKSFLNLQSCALSTLSQFSKNFVDLVGQFENQKMLSEEYQLSLLDSYANLKIDVAKYQKEYQNLLQVKRSLNALYENQFQRVQREDYLKYQINEIESFNPSVEDEQNLINKKNQILSLEKRREVITEVLNNLTENPTSNILNLLKKSFDLCHLSDEVIPKSITNKISEAFHLLEDASFDLTKSQDSQEIDTQSLDNILERIDSYQKLKAKYAGNTALIIDQYTKFSKELADLAKVDSEILQMEQRLKKCKNEVLSLAQLIHNKRDDAAKGLSLKLTKAIRKLNMLDATIFIKTEQVPNPNEFGITKVHFFAETNLGEGLFKVKDCASGGELSRILLAVRQLVSANDSISVFLFDEIDAGVGGKTALCVGQALQEVSSKSQVMAITHLPQIANYADRLIHVSKYLTDNTSGHKRTISTINEVFGPDRKKQIQAMTPL